MKELARWQCPNSVPWECIVFAPNGSHFAAVAWDRLDDAFIFDLRDPGSSWTIPAKQSKCAGFSPRSGRLAVAWMDDARIYEWTSDTPPTRLRGHSNTLSDLAFSADGRVLATVGHDRKLRVWDVESGAEVYSVVAHRDWVRSVSFAPDSWSLVTAGDDGHVRLWHTETGQSLLELPDEGQVVLKAAFSSDGQRIACRTEDCRIVVYEGIPRQSTDVP
jgi:WD40 repeat protein